MNAATWCLVLLYASMVFPHSGLAQFDEQDFREPSVGYGTLIHDIKTHHQASDSKRIRDAVTRGLAIVQSAAKKYPSHRQCFSCHHQTLPLFAMREAQADGLAIDEELVTAVKDHTFQSFSSRLDNLRGGQRIGGRANTVGYGLWTLDLAEHEGDETTSAMVDFLLKSQEENGRWVPPSNRPPLEESQVAVTFLSSYYMQRYADTKQTEDVEKAIHKARAWLASAPLKSQEDHNFRLWSLVLLEDASDDKIKEQINELRDRVIAAQHQDGGWSQLPEMKSDAYATGQTVYVLSAIGMPADSVFIKAGVDYLLKTQQDDGSWLVETRSKPVQIFFDNGDPHGKSQFISIAGTSWAVAALANVKLKLIATKNTKKHSQ